MDLRNLTMFKTLQCCDAQLASSIEHCWSTVEPLPRYSGASNPNYTSHGPDHSLALVDIIAYAIAPLKTTVTLTSSELYILLAATLLHDIGMVGGISETVDLRDYRRRTHHMASAAYIKQNWNTLSLKQEYANAIADVAMAHRQIQIDRDIVERPIGNIGTPRTRLCALLLRLADEFHITFDRVPLDHTLLGLPKESARHFNAAANVLGREFDASKCVVMFSVNVETEEEDAWLISVKDKIRIELGSLSPIMSRYGIPYTTTNWCENRTILIKHKLTKRLLAKGTLTRTVIADEIKEKPDDIERFLNTEGTVAPFFYDQANDTCSLTCDSATFEMVAREFLTRSTDHENKLLFLRSRLALSLMNDRYLDSLVAGSLDSFDDKSCIYHAICTSPSALGYILDHKDNLPKKNLVGGSGLLQIIMGEVHADVLHYPDMLLEPGLLDDLYQDGQRDRKTWESLKIRQVYEYHKAFDQGMILDQYCVPNEYERDSATPPEGKTVTFTIEPKDTGCDLPHPLLLLAAARRLGFTLEMESGKDIRFGLVFDGMEERQKEAVEKATSAKLTIEPTSLPQNLSGVLFCTLERQDGTNIIRPTVHFCKEANELDKPLLMHFELKPNANVADKYKITVGFGLNVDILDCVTAAILMELVSTPDTTIEIRGLPFAAAETLKCPASLFIEMVNASLTTIEQPVCNALAKIQTLIGNKIPYPLYSLPNEILDMISNVNVSVKQDAENVYASLTAKMACLEKPALSPVIVEVHVPPLLVDRRFYCLHMGVHQPRPNVTFVQAEKPPVVREILDNPSSACEIREFINLSPPGAVRYIENNPRDNVDLHPCTLRNRIAKNICEYKSNLLISWEAATQKYFSAMTYNRWIVSPVEKWRRWLMEAHYCDVELKDIRRAYLAAKEAWRLQQTDPCVCLTFGWYAFRVGRTHEAMRVTQTAATSSALESRIIAHGNLGLCHLKLAATVADSRTPDIAFAIFLI